MAETTGIEWTNATWNPVIGCSIVSPGCTNCYAMRDAWRKNTNPRLPRYHGLTKMTKGGPVWTGKVRTVPELLDWPLRKKKPLRIFVNSMSDLFHEDVTEEFIVKTFAVMMLAQRHKFQILTKRAERMLDVVTRIWASDYVNDVCAMFMDYDDMPMIHRLPPENIWLGVSVEDQVRADERVPLLLQTPAAVRWISAEPLLGPINLTRIRHQIAEHSFETFDALYHKDSLNKGKPAPGLDWVVVGGESGPGARPFDIAWARSLRDQCRAAGVPFFLKQIGAEPRGWCAANTPEIVGAEDASGKRAEGTDGDCDYYEASEMAQPCSGYGRRCAVLKDRKGGDPAEWPEDLRIREYPA